MDPQALPASPHYETAIFNGNTASTTLNWHTWTKPVGKVMASFVVIGGGGGGGTGVIGAVSTAAGGGGGGSGGMTILDIPLALLPDRLYISVAQAVQGAGLNTYVCTQPETTITPGTNSADLIAYANGGGVGGNGSGATGGIAGTAAAAATAAGMPLTFAFVMQTLAGQAGAAGGTTGSGSSVTLPTTGLRITGGAGGGGLPASGTGSVGGQISGPGGLGLLPTVLGGVGPTTATTPANQGASGVNVRDAGWYYYGGTGGSSTNGGATGAGLVQAPGGNGGIGCGGGGMGGALTGSTAAAPSRGGPGLVIVTCY